MKAKKSIIILEDEHFNYHNQCCLCGQLFWTNNLQEDMCEECQCDEDVDWEDD